MWRKTKDKIGNEGNMSIEGNVGDEGNMENVESKEEMYIPGAVDKLESAVDTLITTILECEEYLAYRAELDKVLQIPDLKAQIDEYRKRNYELQSRPDIDFDKLDRFEKEYENFRSNPAVSDFLAAELAFCKRMQAIETRITVELDFQ